VHSARARARARERERERERESRPVCLPLSLFLSPLGDDGPPPVRRAERRVDAKLSEGSLFDLLLPIYKHERTRAREGTSLPEPLGRRGRGHEDVRRERSRSENRESERGREGDGRTRRDGLQSAVSPAWGLYTSDYFPPSPHPLSAYVTTRERMMRTLHALPARPPRAISFSRSSFFRLCLPVGSADRSLPPPPPPPSSWSSSSS